jgi:vancomycin resistance protein VanW
MVRKFRSIIRAVVPFSIRLAIVRWRDSKTFSAEAKDFPVERGAAMDYPFVMAIHQSPLRRVGTTYEDHLQRGKETNVARSARLIHGIILRPGQVFSYHHSVGAPTKRNGFVIGAELHDDELKPGIGGGACQVSNLLYVLALRSGCEVTERHRHGFDLFPDSERTVPFGCGATVFFPSKDLRFRNLLDQPILIDLTSENGFLVGRMRATRSINIRWELFEKEGSIERQGDRWIRRNVVARRMIVSDIESEVEVVAENIATCLYEPEGPP